MRACEAANAPRKSPHNIIPFTLSTPEFNSAWKIACAKIWPLIRLTQLYCVQAMASAENRRFMAMIVGCPPAVRRGLDIGVACQNRDFCRRTGTVAGVQAVGFVKGS
jgi:hypothetical protein